MKICQNCGSGSIITDREFVSGQGWIDRPRCMKCGREKFEEVENPAKIIRKELIEQVKKEEVVAEKRICKYEGCTKRVLAGGYCYRHYKAVHGHPYEGGKINHKGGNIEMPGSEKKIRVRIKPEVLAERIAQGKVKAPPDSTIPLISLFLYPELLEKLTQAAKKEWRTPEGQAAYLIEKALQG